MVLLTGGATNVGTAKTAVNLLRYKPDEVVGILDAAQAGKVAADVFGVGGAIPFVASLEEVPSANAVAIGVAPAGGRIPDPMRAAILEGIGRGMTILSGLHQFLSDDLEFAEAARKSGAKLVDVRKNNERDVAHRKDIRPGCLRIHTVGHDCNVGKMVVSLELTLALRRAGIDAKFVATGQTGIMIEGDGCPVDAVVVDFINGAAEKLVLANQSHPVIVVEGQGSITHPRYSAVTLGLLHGCMPDGLILCYEMGRETVYGMDSTRLHPLATYKQLYETLANPMHPCKVIGFGINGRRATAEEVEAERARVEAEFGLPACDVLRHGCQPLLEAVARLGRELGKPLDSTTTLRPTTL